MGEALAFENVARSVARTLNSRGEGDAETHAAQFERAIGWDRHKLFKRAQELAVAQGYPITGGSHVRNQK